MQIVRDVVKQLNMLYIAQSSSIDMGIKLQAYVYSMAQTSVST
jgi:hypothetical protein